MLDKLLSNLAVEVQAFALCELDSGWRLCLPGPPAALIHFVLQGEGRLAAPNGSGVLDLLSSWMAVVPAGKQHTLETGEPVEHEVRIDAPPSGPPIHHIVAGPSPQHDLIIACGVVNARFGEAIDVFDHLPDLLSVDLSDVPHAAQLFHDILHEQTKGLPGSKTLISALMTQLLVHLFRDLANAPPSSLPWLAALDDTRLMRAVDQVLQDPGAHHSVDSLADAAYMGRSAFAEHFTSHFSRSPMSFVNHVRMERAAKLLREGHLSIEQIANRMGFASRSHFSQGFKRHTGQAPGDYREH